MSRFVDVGMPVYVSRLHKLGLYPKDLTTALEILFSKDDLCIYYPVAFDATPDVSFYIFNINENLFYRYIITSDDWLFRDDEDGVDIIVDNLIEVEEVFDRAEFKELIHFMHYRDIAPPELPSLQKFDNFLDGMTSYTRKEIANDKEPNQISRA